MINTKYFHIVGLYNTKVTVQFILCAFEQARFYRTPSNKQHANNCNWITSKNEKQKHRKEI